MEVGRADSCRANSDPGVSVAHGGVGDVHQFQSFGRFDKGLHESPESPVDEEPDGRIQSKPETDTLVPGTGDFPCMAAQQSRAPDEFFDLLVDGGWVASDTATTPAMMMTWAMNAV